MSSGTLVQQPNEHPLQTALASFALAASILGCNDSTPPALMADGVIKNATGCTYILTSTRKLQPLTLPTEFRVADLPVRVAYRFKPTPNICMAGDVIEVVAIERLP